MPVLGHGCCRAGGCCVSKKASSKQACKLAMAAHAGGEWLAFCQGIRLTVCVGLELPCRHIQRHHQSQHVFALLQVPKRHDDGHRRFHIQG